MLDFIVTLTAVHHCLYNAGCRLVLEREVAQHCDDFKGFGALVNEIGKRIKLLSHSYSVQTALIAQLSALKNVAACDDVPTSVADAFTRQNECYIKVGSELSTYSVVVSGESLASCSIDCERCWCVCC